MARAARTLPDTIATLRNEHRYMELLLDTMLERLETGALRSGSDFFLVQDIAQYLHEYPDTVHHPTEDILFERLVTRDPASKEQVQSLRRDHAWLENNTSEILRLLDIAYSRRTKAARNTAIGALETYVRRLRRHMQFEESTLFPRAVDCLAHEDWKTIERRVDATGDPLFGETIVPRYRALYEFFARRAETASARLAKAEVRRMDGMIAGAAALEDGVRELLALVSRQGDTLAHEARDAGRAIVSEPGLGTLVRTPLRLVRNLGAHSVGFGVEASGISLRTLRTVASCCLQPGAR